MCFSLTCLRGVEMDPYNQSARSPIARTVAEWWGAAAGSGVVSISSPWLSAAISADTGVGTSVTPPLASPP